MKQAIHRVLLAAAALMCALAGLSRADLAGLTTRESLWQVEFPQPATREVAVEADWFDYGELRMTIRLEQAPLAPVRIMAYLVNGDGWYYRSAQTGVLRDDRPHELTLDISPQSCDWVPAGHLRPWDGYVTWLVKAVGLKAFCDAAWSGKISVEDVALVPASSSRRARALVDFSAEPSPAYVGRTLEMTFRLPGGHRNPFDPRQADVVAEIRTPEGQIQRVSGFFYQDFIEQAVPDSVGPSASGVRLVPVGPGLWKVRYCPKTAGRYRCRIVVSGDWDLRSAELTLEAIDPPDAGSPSAEKPAALWEAEQEEFLYAAESAPRGQHYHFTGAQWTYSPEVQAPAASPAWRTPIEWTARWGTFHGSGRYSLQQAWLMDSAVRKAERLGLQYPLAFADREELYEQNKFNWLTNPLNQSQGGPLERPGQYFAHPETAALVARRARYAIARWGSSPAVSCFVMRNVVSADGAERWCSELARHLAAMPPPLKPLLSAHPQTLGVAARRTLADFADDTTVWQVDRELTPGISAAVAPLAEAPGDQALALHGRFPGEMAIVVRPDDSLWGYDQLSFDLYVPPGAPNDLRPMVYLKDGDWWWYETLLEPFVRPGDWTRFVVDLSDLSAQWEPVGHDRPWNTYLLGRVQMIGLRIFGHKAYSGPVYIDNIELCKSGRQAMLDHQPLRVSRLSVNAERVGVYDRFEATFELSRTFENPFDPDEVDIVGRFVSPSGRVFTVPAFFYAPYRRERRTLPGVGEAEVLIPDGPPVWKVRFAPTEPGPHRFSICGLVPERFEDNERSFVATPSNKPGFIRISKSDPRYFEFDNGQFYYPIGHNVRSPIDVRQPYPYDFPLNGQLGTFLYDEYFTRMGEAGLNWSRVWMTPWWCGLEWNRAWRGFHGVGRYNMENAWRLDYVVDLAAAHGLYLQLVTMNHGQLSIEIDREWQDNPMNSANGGWLSPDKDEKGNVIAEGAYKYHTDERARKATRNRLRYTIARWAYSPHIMQWELCSEVEFTDAHWRVSKTNPSARVPAVQEWHAAMARYVRQIDPYARLVSSHFAHAWRGADIWQLGEMDVVQTNAYTAFPELGGPGGGLSTVIHRFYYERVRHYDKPALVAEYGWKWDRATPQELDAEYHNGPWIMWTTPLSGATGFWWWLHVNHKDRYPHMAAFARYVAGEDRRGQNLEQSKCSVLASGGTLSARGVQNKNVAYIWVFYGAEGRSAPQIEGLPPVSGAMLTVPALADGAYNVEFWNTFTGAIILTQATTSTDGTLTVPLPTVQNDLAVKIKPR